MEMASFFEKKRYNGQQEKYLQIEIKLFAQRKILKQNYFYLFSNITFHNAVA